MINFFLLLLEKKIRSRSYHKGFFKNRNNVFKTINLMRFLREIFFLFRICDLIFFF